MADAGEACAGLREDCGAWSSMLERAVEALGCLLGRAGAAGTGSLQAARHADLLESLRSNVATLEEKLAGDPQWAELQGLRAEISKQALWAATCPDEPWNFTSHVLLLLLCLKRCMLRLTAAFHPPPANPKSAEAAPPLSPDTLSISQEKTVQAAFQFVVTLGLCPYLLSGVGLPLGCRTEFSVLVRNVISPASLSSAMRRLYATCIVLLEVAQHPSLGSLILTRHLGDLLAGLCQLGFCPARRKGEQAHLEGELRGLSEEERTRCREALQGLLDRVYQPLVVRELLLLQGGSKQGSLSSRSEGKGGLAPAPAWLRRLCGQLLSERLVRPNGVQAVVRGILEGAGAGPAGGKEAEAAAADWRKCDTVARILSSCPQQSLSLEDYYRQVCPQVLQLLLLPDKLAAAQFQRVATSTVLAVARQHPQEAEKHLLRPLLEPLLRCVEAAEGSLGSLPAGTVLVEEDELTGCVESIFKVYVAGNEPLPVLLDSLQPALGVLFSLYCFTKQNVSFLRNPCQEIMLWFLEKAERETAFTVLEGLARLGGAPRPLPTQCQFQVAGDGGAVITTKGTVSEEEEEEDEEEEALYQKISSEQWQLEQLVDLVSRCQSSGLAGDFFIRSLKGLTHIAGGGGGRGVAAAAAASMRSASVPLSCKSPPRLEWGHSPGLEQQERQLRVLQLVAMLCEGLPASLFTDIAQVVEFVAATLQRACVNLSCSSEAQAVEAQTLSLAMGLVAAMLAGAVQLKSADFAVLQRLLPTLEKVSRLHPEPVIQELAADLRASICTHGAFSPETVTSAARSTLGQQDSGPASKAGTGEVKPRTPHPEPSSSHTPSGFQARQPTAGQGASVGALQELLLSTWDPDIPARAAALRSLSRLIEQRDPEALKMREKLLQVFTGNLEHGDSFVYLSAIQGVALLADAFPEQVLPCLLSQYAGAQSDMQGAQTAETRMKIGEALMRATRALGDMVSPYRDRLIHAFLRGARDPESALRASSLSNLGELCQILQFQLGSVVHELSSCLTAIVQTDQKAEVRRAAVHVVVLVLRGLSERATEVLRDVLLDLYRLLKSVVRCERDEITVLHAQLALEELDGLMRRLLFPQQTLEKKIVVLP